MDIPFLDLKLKNLLIENCERVEIAENYLKQLINVDDLVLPVLAKGCPSNYHLFIIRTKKRNELQKHLQENGIGTVIHYPIPPHKQKAYIDLHFSANNYPIATLIAETCLSLPIFPGMTEKEINYICNTIKTFYA